MLFWLEQAEPAIRAEEQLRSGSVPPERVFDLALIAEGTPEAAALWVEAYNREEARAAVARHLAGG